MLPLINIAYAATPNIDSLLLKINQNIINPLIALMFVFATVSFLAGVVKFYIASSEEKDRTTGHNLIKWGLVGMFIMVSVFGIMKIIVNTLGVNLTEFGTSIPSNH